MSPGTKPAQKGSYILLIRVEKLLEGMLRGKPYVLTPGFYAYCGSAMGPGGLKARIQRHSRMDKKVHWHVDQVTTRAPVIAAGISTSASECALVDQLMRQPGTGIPVPGLGSSDCKRCSSHFLKLKNRKSFEALSLELFEA